MDNPLGTQHPTDIAVFECIAEHGIEAVTMERVARRLGPPRATFYRQVTSWRGLVRATHRRATALIGWWVPPPGGDLHYELEWWWATMMEFFATDWGKAFLAMRPYAATRFGMHEVEHYELELMPNLTGWTGAPRPIVRAFWSLALSAACPTLTQDERSTMRELVRGMISPRADELVDEGDGFGELGQLVALNAPL